LGRRMLRMTTSAMIRRVRFTHHPMVHGVHPT
jgi:hypothetical protein